jgi:hypothetical protein
MRTAVNIADPLSYVLMVWFAVGTLLRQLFPRYCDQVLREYQEGRYA